MRKIWIKYLLIFAAGCGITVAAGSWLRGGLTPDEWGIMIPVKNPLYSCQNPLKFDSGYFEDNQSCLVCHKDFKEEPFSVKHLQKGITCMVCHGDSLTHSGDEFNITRPDVIWGRAEINPFCSQCHPGHLNPEGVKKFREEWLGLRRPTGRLVQEDSVCTDCHGEHAIMVGEGNFK